MNSLTHYLQLVKSILGEASPVDNIEKIVNKEDPSDSTDPEQMTDTDTKDIERISKLAKKR